MRKKPSNMTYKQPTLLCMLHFETESTLNLEQNMKLDVA